MALFYENIIDNISGVSYVLLLHDSLQTKYNFVQNYFTEFLICNCKKQPNEQNCISPGNRIRMDSMVHLIAENECLQLCYTNSVREFSVPKDVRFCLKYNIPLCNFR